MPTPWCPGGQPGFLPKEELSALIKAVQADGYTVLGPTPADGVVFLRPISSVEDLPLGIEDVQAPGRYRTARGEPELYFQCGPGADGPKRYFFPPAQRLFALHVEGDRFALDEGSPQPPKLAMLGIHPCELAAIAIQDHVFGADDPRHFRCESDAYFRQARESALIIAVNCMRAGGTCFCTSMGTGPEAKSGFDLALTELRAGFVVHVGTNRGAQLLSKLNARPPTSTEGQLAELLLKQAREGMTRQMNTQGLAEVLDKAIDHPHWAEIAKKCLGCGNCTQVCPTCFCSTVVDSNALTGGEVTRTRHWESCYTHQFSYTHSGPVRHTIKAQHRHWLRHKLATWHAQFGGYGCVGCGRCITWCPVGIDLTEEMATIRGDAQRAVAAQGKGVPS